MRYEIKKAHPPGYEPGRKANLVFSMNLEQKNKRREKSCQSSLVNFSRLCRVKPRIVMSTNVVVAYHTNGLNIELSIYGILDKHFLRIIF